MEGGFVNKAAITIKDVAREARVSVATVSRALNGHENVAEPVRQLVLEVAARLRYTPHAAARSLSSRRTNTVGVVLPDLYGEFFSELMRGIDNVARSRRQHLLVSSYHGDQEQQGAALRAMRGRVDGLLVLSPYAESPGFLTDNLPQSLPTVLIDHHPVAGLGLLCLHHGGQRRQAGQGQQHGRFHWRREQGHGNSVGSGERKGLNITRPRRFCPPHLGRASGPPVAARRPKGARHVLKS